MLEASSRSRSRRETTRVGVLRAIFTSPVYVALTALFIVLYYAFFYYLILASDRGIFLVTAPIYLVYALVVSASLLLAASVYVISRSIHAKYAGAEGSALSVITSALNGLIVGCNCYAPILSSALYALGFGTLGVSSAISFLGAYQAELLLVFIAMNLAFLYYQLGRMVRINKSAARLK